MPVIFYKYSSQALFRHIQHFDSLVEQMPKISFLVGLREYQFQYQKHQSVNPARYFQHQYVTPTQSVLPRRGA